MSAYPLGVVDVVFWPDPAEVSAQRARELGFAHIDVLVDVDPESIVLPIGCPTAFPARRGMVRHSGTPRP